MNTDIELRLRRLERHNRILLTCLGCIAIVGTLTAAKKMVVQEADILKAKRFILLNSRGDEVGSFGSEKGDTFLKVGPGNAVTLAALNEGGGSLRMVDGPNSASIGTSMKDGSAFSLQQQTKLGTSIFSGTTNGGAPHVFITAANKRGFAFYAEDPALVLHYPDNSPIVSLTPRSLGLNGPKLLLNDTTGNLIQELPDPAKAAEAKAASRSTKRKK